MTQWLTILVAGVLTYATRLSFIMLLDKIQAPDWFWRGLRFVPVAVLSAIIVPELAQRGGAVDLSWRNPQLLAGIAAVLVAWRTRNMLVTIAAGMAALVLLAALLP